MKPFYFKVYLCILFSAIFLSSSFGQSVETAVRTLDNEMMKQALDNGGKANSKWAGNYAIQWAAIGGHADMIKMLIDKGADPNQTTTIFDCPLLCAIKDRSAHEPDSLRGINQKSNSLIIRNCKGDTAKAKKWLQNEDLSRWSSVYDKVAVLVEKGANVNKYDKFGQYNAFLLSVLGGHYDLVKLMLEKGKPNFSARYNTVSSFKSDMVKQWEQGVYLADVTDRPNALLLAALAGDLPMVKLLVEGGADVNFFYQPTAGKSEYMTALDIAEAFAMTDMSDYLKSKGGVRKSTTNFRPDDDLYPAGSYCVPIVYQCKTTGMTISVSYSCRYIFVRTAKEYSRKQIKTAALAYADKEYTKSPCMQEYDVMFFQRELKDCKNFVQAKYDLHDFMVGYTDLNQ